MSPPRSTPGAAQRFEFFNREFADPAFAELIPVQRPQEALTAHALDAMVRAVNGVPDGPFAGGPVELVVTTGDSVDNAQWNELQAILDLFDGGVVRLDSGAPGYEGVQAASWPDDIFWRPDGGADLFHSGLGFPDHRGLLAAALAAFRSGGLDVPWLTCNGNHEALVQGLGTITPEIADALIGGTKPTRLRDDVSRDEALELFTSAVHVFMSGAPVPVSADPGRRALTRRSFVEAHFRDGGRPRGHGFTDINRVRGTAHYVHDVGAVRFVVLDTACPQGGSDGAVDEDQAAWLAEVLAEVHSSYRGVDGSDVRTPNENLLLDHDGIVAETGVRAVEGWSGQLLAGLHRELAANVPFAGPESPLAGSSADRNVVLRMRAPFPLRRARGR